MVLVQILFVFKAAEAETRLLCGIFGIVKRKYLLLEQWASKWQIIYLWFLFLHHQPSANKKQTRKEEEEKGEDFRSQIILKTP
jgi:hypothetical protein